MLCDVTSHWAAREPDESSGDAKASLWRQGMCRRTKAVLDGKPLPAGVKLVHCRSCGVSTCSQCLDALRTTVHKAQKQKSTLEFECTPAWSFVLNQEHETMVPDEDGVCYVDECWACENPPLKNPKRAEPQLLEELRDAGFTYRTISPQVLEMPTVMVRVTSIDEHLQNGEPMDILVQLVQPSPHPCHLHPHFHSTPTPSCRASCA